MRQFSRQSAASSILAAVTDAPDDFTIARELLARQRRLGTSFEDAWAMVFEALPPPAVPGQRRRTSDVEREHTRTALAATELDWRLSYELKPPREPPYSERAVRQRNAQRRAVAA